MAKNKDKGEPQSRADQVRAAVEQAFGATASGAAPVRERAQELAEELAGAANRFREVLEELRPPGGDDLAALRERVAALETRVAELEAAKAPKPRARRTAAATPRASGVSASAGASTAKRAAPKRSSTNKG